MQFSDIQTYIIPSTNTTEIVEHVDFKEAGCCQMSASDNKCAYWDYLNGVCIKLEKKNIGCKRGHWVPKATYNKEKGTCEHHKASSVRSTGKFSVGGYWEPWHTATNPGDGNTSMPSYYENDFKSLDKVFYAFLTLDGAPDPDQPHEIYWDGSCLYDVETRDCVAQDLIWPAKWPNPDAWNGVKIEAMYKACKFNNK